MNATAQKTEAAQHTPGPWVLSYVSEPSDPSAIIYCNYASMSMRTVGEARGEIITGELLANGRLIAAAPELLEALQTMLLRADLHSNSEVVMARAAIAKATKGAYP